MLNRDEINHSGNYSPPRTRPNRHWLKSDIDEVIRRRDNGETFRAIAEAVGSTKNVVATIYRHRARPEVRIDSYSRAKKYKEAVNEMTKENATSYGDPWTKADEELLESLVAQGKPLVEIAEDLGRTYRAVSTRHPMIMNGANRSIGGVRSSTPRRSRGKSATPPAPRVCRSCFLQLPALEEGDFCDECK